DMAVLGRKRAQFRLLRAAIEAKGLPVEVVGLGGLLTVPEVADVVATLRVLHDPTASGSLARLLTGPRWRIGPRDLVALGRRARDLAREHRAPGAADPGPAGPGAAAPGAASTGSAGSGPVGAGGADPESAGPGALSTGSAGPGAVSTGSAGSGPVGAGGAGTGFAGPAAGRPASHGRERPGVPGQQRGSVKHEDPRAQAVTALTAEQGSLVEALDDLGPAAAYSAPAFTRFSALAAELRTLRAHVGRPLPDL